MRLEMLGGDALRRRQLILAKDPEAACFAAEEAMPEDQDLGLPLQELGHRRVHLGVRWRPPPGRCLSGGPVRAGYLPMDLTHVPVAPTSAEFAQPGPVTGATAKASTGASSPGTAAASLAMKAYFPSFRDEVAIHSRCSCPAEAGAGREAAGGLLLRCLGCLAEASCLHGLALSRSSSAWLEAAGCRKDAGAGEAQATSVVGNRSVVGSSSDYLAGWRPSSEDAVRSDPVHLDPSSELAESSDSDAFDVCPGLPGTTGLLEVVACHRCSG